jgi:hypothetical protein
MREMEETTGFLSCFLPGHHSMPPASGYPLAGCSPAEPASVSPDRKILKRYVRHVNHHDGAQVPI